MYPTHLTLLYLIPIIPRDENKSQLFTNFKIVFPDMYYHASRFFVHFSYATRNGKL
jgi:hypothetical protein